MSPTKAAGVLPFSEGEEALRPPRSDLRRPGKISRLDELPCLRGKVQLGRWQKERHGETKFQWTKGHTLFSKAVLYLKLCIEDNGGRGGVMQGQQFLVLIEARKLIICKSSGDLHHLLAQRPVNILRPFLQKTYFSLKVIGQEPPSKSIR